MRKTDYKQCDNQIKQFRKQRRSNNNEKKQKKNEQIKINFHQSRLNTNKNNESVAQMTRNQCLLDFQSQFICRRPRRRRCCSLCMTATIESSKHRKTFSFFPS